MNEERERRLQEALRRFRPPPPLDQERLWQRIEGGLEERVRQRRRLQRGLTWAAGVAAAGILLGALFRSTLERPPARTPLTSTEAPGLTSDRALLAATLRDAADLLEHLDPAEAHPSDAAEARHTLADVRLLMQLAEGRDPSLTALLSDLELVLAQAVYALETRSPESAARIADSVRDRRLPARMRSASPPMGT